MSGTPSDDTLKDTPKVTSPVLKQFGPRPTHVVVRFGTISQQGRSRPNNEDHFLVAERRRSREVLRTNLPSGSLLGTDDCAYLMAVADGMGGAACGEVASTLAFRAGWEMMPQAVNWTFVVNDREIEDFRERAAVVFRQMDKTILDHAHRDPACKGMATTVTAAYSTGLDVFIAHVGDSRAYLFHAGQIFRLTHDHTVAQHHIDLGLPVECQSWRHQLTNVLGGDGRQIYVEFHYFHLADGDKLLLCTNGLTEYASDEEIATFLTSKGDPQATAQALLNLAVARGGEDDVTVVLAEYKTLAGREDRGF